jgi:O-antigen ligase/tetratricopeptide (TPR) repeat protein
MTDTLDRWMSRALQALVLGLPLFLGGRQPAAVAAGAATVLVLLAVTLRERRRRGDAPHAPGIAALAAFVALALASTVPLPPALLRVLTPAAADLYARMLPGWPGGGEWSVWRALAIDPYAVWGELTHLSIGFGVFAVVVAYPWADGAPNETGRSAFARLVLTMLAGGALLATIALLGAGLGNGRVLWISDAAVMPGRASGPFVNPNHFAAWLEMVIPVGLAYAFALARRVGRRLVRSIEAGRGMGVQRRRAWVTSLITHQERLWAPLLAGTTLVLMLVAHLAAGSRGGTAALLVGLGIAAAGMMTRRGRSGRRGRARRWAPLVLALALLAAGAASVVAWGLADADQREGAAEVGDVSLASRFWVAQQGSGIVRDHPLLGTGLGTWLHAFRPYIAPPIDGGIWDHAHNDYLELAAETGLVGCAMALLFVIAVVRALRAPRAESGCSGWHGSGAPRGFEPPDWRAALGDTAFLRWGLAGSLAAIALHSAVDFSLRMPANLLLAMLVIALLVLSGRSQPMRRSLALPVLALLLAVPLVPQGLNTVLVAAGGTPIAPADCLTSADLQLAEEGDAARDGALGLLHRALDGSPADREIHEALAEAVGPGPDGDVALRRALALEPSSADLRDELGLRLLARGEEAAGAAELEESMYRLPYLASHAYLSPQLHARSKDAASILRALADGDTITVRLASLDAPMGAAIDRGLRRALDEAPAGGERAGILDDLATLLEAKERWSDAASLLSAEAERSLDGASNLARAARDYLRAQEYAAAEQSLLAAVLRTPDQGDLYRDLAVEVYAARGDFLMADTVLEAGERNAVDLLPVYDGVTKVLTKRESAIAARPADATLPGPEEMIP